MTHIAFAREWEQSWFNCSVTVVYMGQVKASDFDKRLVNLTYSIVSCELLWRLFASAGVMTSQIKTLTLIFFSFGTADHHIRTSLSKLQTKHFTSVLVQVLLLQRLTLECPSFYCTREATHKKGTLLILAYCTNKWFHPLKRLVACTCYCFSHGLCSAGQAMDSPHLRRFVKASLWKHRLLINYLSLKMMVTWMVTNQTILLQNNGICALLELAGKC